MSTNAGPLIMVARTNVTPTDTVTATLVISVTMAGLIVLGLACLYLAWRKR